MCRAPRSQTPDDFFTALEADAVDRPTIVGELYFEYHRGTYTTQAAVKRGNREGERALHDAELLSAVAGRVRGGEHPAEQLGQAWQLLLLNQFHDILPGSSIGQVYERRRGRARRGGGRPPRRARRRAGALEGRGPGATPVNTLGGRPGGVAEHPDGELVWVEAPAYGFGAVATAPGAVTVDRGTRDRSCSKTAGCGPSSAATAGCDR